MTLFGLSTLFLVTVVYERPLTIFNRGMGQIMPTTLQFAAIYRPSYGPLYEGIPFNDVAAFSQLYRAKSATRVHLIILLKEFDNQFEKKKSQNFTAIFS